MNSLYMYSESNESYFFCQEFIDIITNIFDYTRDSLLQELTTEGGKCDYCTWFMRLITAGKSMVVNSGNDNCDDG